MQQSDKPTNAIKEQSHEIQASSRGDANSTEYFLATCTQTDDGKRILPVDHTDSIQMPENADFLHWDAGRLHHYFPVNDPRIASMVIHSCQIGSDGKETVNPDAEIVLDTAQQPFTYCFISPKETPWSFETFTADVTALEPGSQTQTNIRKTTG